MNGHRPRVHGGPGPNGPARWDFSSNGNAAGPCPQALAAVAAADPRHYPHHQHQAVREALAALHGVHWRQVLPAAGASEFMQRISAVARGLTNGPAAACAAVHLPPMAYGDYATAAQAHRWPVVHHGDVRPVALRWFADPGSPLGQDGPPPAHPGAWPTVLDLAYAPLRLDGASPWSAAQRQQAIQLHSPGKALGLLGLRAAYAVLPAPGAADWAVDRWAVALEAAAPSWPWGVHAEALLLAWASAPVQTWLQHSLPTLRGWRALQRQGLQQRGMALADSTTPFFAARLPSGAASRATAAGLALRDTASFGLPGWCRLNTLPPEGQAALWACLDTLHP
jgi:histidinol-phosphate aminotransferase